MSLMEVGDVIHLLLLKIKECAFSKGFSDWGSIARGALLLGRAELGERAPGCDQEKGS
jgi:hypothetical protein